VKLDEVECAPHGSDIYGKLELKEWIESALDPVKMGPKFTYIKRADATDCTRSNPQQPRKCYEPYDLISHSLTFVVVWNVNATPAWTLVRFRGPGAGGGAGPSPSSGTGAGTGGGSSPGTSTSLVAASRIDTHLLSISLGPNTPQGQADKSAFQTFEQLRAVIPPIERF
jgi:hypothetical protein